MKWLYLAAALIHLAGAVIMTRDRYDTAVTGGLFLLAFLHQVVIDGYTKENA